MSDYYENVGDVSLECVDCGAQIMARTLHYRTTCIERIKADRNAIRADRIAAEKRAREAEAAAEANRQAAEKWGRVRFCQTCGSGNGFVAPPERTCPWCAALSARDAMLRAERERDDLRDVNRGLLRERDEARDLAAMEERLRERAEHEVRELLSEPIESSYDPTRELIALRARVADWERTYCDGRPVEDGLVSLSSALVAARQAAKNLADALDGQTRLRLEAEARLSEADGLLARVKSLEDIGGRALDERDELEAALARAQEMIAKKDEALRHFKSAILARMSFVDICGEPGDALDVADAALALTLDVPAEKK